MQNFNSGFLILVSCLILFGCSDDTGNKQAETTTDHVWKEQTKTIDKAKQVEGMLLDSVDSTRQAIENQGE